MNSSSRHLHDLLVRLNDLHIADTGNERCQECQRSWPCDTALVAATTAAPSSDDVRLSPTQAVGRSLATIERRLALYGHRMDRVVAALHEMVLVPDVAVRAPSSASTDIQVGVQLPSGRIHTLWGLHVDESIYVRIAAPVGETVTRDFLSGILLESFGLRGAEEIVGWWDAIETSASRSLILELTAEPAVANTLLTLVNATKRAAERLHLHPLTR